MCEGAVRNASFATTDLPSPLVGRGRGWGDEPGGRLAGGLSAASRPLQNLHRLSKIFTPPLTPPHRGEGNLVEIASDGFIVGLQSARAGVAACQQMFELRGHHDHCD